MKLECSVAAMGVVAIGWLPLPFARPLAMDDGDDEAVSDEYFIIGLR